ncbi:hypothetical protein PANPA_00372 (plasmid) [Pantoea sp. Nvir]|uniref:hypothetical protein n=1 Tax=Pantoea TaxID=53335 RepID=UPI000CDDC556|nr:hypothetical protein [Pantoea agglomerans]POW55789.1 hypothetical protein C3408_15875 [Pantoea alvi]UBN52532.1 hypothetical protein LB453_00580 [Pantoea agglomerans]
MNMLSTKSVLKTAALALTAFLLNQGTALAETAAASTQTINNSTVSQLKSVAHGNDNLILASGKGLASGLRINSACDDDGSPCPHDDTTDDAS